MTVEYLNLSFRKSSKIIRFYDVLVNTDVLMNFSVVLKLYCLFSL